MSRRVRPFPPTWLDKAFTKDFKKLSREGQRDFTQRLGELIEALRDCAHPVLDSALRRWSPSTYHVAGRIECRLVEYRFPGTVRVIACYFETETDKIDDTILLVAVTLKHDHGRLKRLIEGRRSELRAPPEGEESESGAMTSVSDDNSSTRPERPENAS